jgi:molybdenum cofactor cytidylyltransferase
VIGDPTHSRTAAVLLAAGASRRLGAPKQLLADAQGDLLLARLVREAHLGGCAPVIVVTGAHADGVREVLVRSTARLVHNPGWEDGMASSIRAGLGVLPAYVAAAVLMACDQPAVTGSHLREMLRRHARHGGRVVSTYEQVAGIPALWPRDDWPALAALQGDQGARRLLRGDEDQVELPGGARDLDTSDDVAAWRGTGR